MPSFDFRRALHRRLTLLGSVIVLVAAMIGWSAYTAWREAGSLRKRFSAAQLESFRIADRVQSGILKLNDALLDYELHGQNPADLNRFNTESSRFDIWLTAQQHTLTTPAEQHLLSRIDAAYDIYLATAEAITRGTSPDSRILAERTAAAEQAAQRLVALGTELSQAHRQALGVLLDAGEQSLARLQIVIFGALLLLIALAAWAVQVVYREMIAPLRVQLLESHALIERQEKLASLGILAAGVAHEIRNPLTAIRARLFTLQKALTKESRPFADSEFIAREISRLERIVRDFLQFARPGEPQRVMFSVRELLHEVCELMTPDIESNSVALGIAPGADISLFGDIQQLKQVLINLVRNAAESMGETGGRISLQARIDRMPVGGVSTDAAVLEVEDTGAGIPAEVQERLFDPFFTTKPSGTGLGLSIAARIVEKHGGTLRFQTRPGHGTTFGLILPLSADS
ncbi:two-component system sensor histidine kinase NtrB [Verrucomicrobiota bacterium sgz303538]